MLSTSLRKGAVLAAVAVCATAVQAQTECRGTKTMSQFGEYCAWGCKDDTCNCIRGACADATTVKRPT